MRCYRVRGSLAEGLAYLEGIHTGAISKQCYGAVFVGGLFCREVCHRRARVAMNEGHAALENGPTPPTTVEHTEIVLAGVHPELVEFVISLLA